MLKPSAAAMIVAVIALAVDAAYLALIVAEGQNEAADVALFAVLIGLAGVAAGVGAFLADSSLRGALLWPAALVLTGIGMLAIFSIGLPLLVAGLLCALAAGGSTRTARRRPTR